MLTAPRNLADLNPRWLRAVADPLSQGYGVEFDCPCGGAAPGCPQRIWLMFTNPLAGPPARIGKQKWQRTGETFEALTLEPSIHHLAPGGATHWHGWLRAGELVSC